MAAKEKDGRKKRVESLREIRDRFFMHHAAYGLGILPLDEDLPDLRPALDSMDPDEARRAKRKFRKLWRKLVKSSTLAGRKVTNRFESKERASRATGMHQRNPGKIHRYNRKAMVTDAIRTGIVRPILDASTGLEDPTRD